MKLKTINYTTQFNQEPEYAAKVIAAIRAGGVSCEKMAAMAGVHVRSIYRSQETGFSKFPLQVTLEIMAGLRHG